MSPPERSPRGSGEAGRPRQGGSHGRARVHVGPTARCGSHLPVEDTASPFAVSPDFAATPWDGALRAVCFR
jgi:hypothetical protein